MLEGELNHHLQESKASGEINRKNGKTKKDVRDGSIRYVDLQYYNRSYSSIERVAKPSAGISLPLCLSGLPRSKRHLNRFRGYSL